ncbi:uncharacterized protein TEOVI_000271600 [Trypanosoma equiperdum]|uniref:SET domain-containing protein n=2 Tax=Trypanozoon TaxID=39700 RepID=Q4GYU9_TRYB2|nr:hypothetical protein, conserved [Trypanosoma brucei brucei TREU927]CAJ16428.1 hypothetical protein, conserved [Trypanosoma brucei brucei TREU927]SCU71136.1 hypothetical protein, conserved [Trypanosoma equiperdum]
MFRLSFAAFTSVAAGSRSVGCSTTFSTTTSAAASSSSSAAAATGKEAYEALMKFLTSSGATFEGVAVRPSAEQCRGLIATQTFREGTTILSVPMTTLSITADRLLNTDFIRSLNPPTRDDVRRLLMARGVNDPVLCDQVHLALLVAGERINVHSPFAPYFDVLPYPAIDDTAVIQRYKDVLDPTQLLEWDDHQRDWVTVLRALTDQWGNAGPPVEVCYWAWRTVLSRMHMLPDRGLAPADVGSSLHYSALATYGRAERQTRIMKRLRATIGAVFGSDGVAEDYRLVPTLLPLLDMVDHLPSSNVSVEVQPRGDRGSCGELQALREIQAGEHIGFSFNRSQGIPFTLYRFGFLPL